MPISDNILVWVPAYNEEESVAFMISELQRAGWPFVICDGFSSDMTAEIARSLGATVVHRSGFGKGYAVRDGLEYASKHGFEGLALIDCDRTYQVDDIARLAELFPGCDMVVGNRDMRDIDTMRRLANRFMTFVFNLLFNAKARDMASGLRILRTKRFKDLLDARNFDIEPQMYCRAVGEGYTIRQTGISYHERHGKSKANFLHLLLLVYRMYRERLRYR